MKIRVQHESGLIETIDIRLGVCTVQEGLYLHRIVCAHGMEHFFTHDGYYDGWGAAIPPTDHETVREIINAVEQNRMIEN